MIKEKFYSSVREHKMFFEGDSVVAAVSGGADSVCLLSLLLCAREEMGITVNCAHINHNLRETAKRDEELVRGICEKNGVPFFLYSPDIASLAKKRGESEETCGRNERYKFFFEVAEKTGSRVVLTAHNKNDNAETVMMHLLRGSGARGLRGIPALRADGVGRPLINISRDEIEEYLAHRGIEYANDETNADDKYKRNFIRLRVFPLFEEYNPSYYDALVRAASAVSEDDDYLNFLAKEADGIIDNGSEIKILANSITDNPVPIAKRIVIDALGRADTEPTLTDIEAVLRLAQAPAGKMHILAGGKAAFRVYDGIVIGTPHEEKSFCYALIPEKEVYIEEIGKRALLTSKKPDGKHIAIRYSEGNMEIRSRRDGDRFSPCNMSGTKKVKDYFIDGKIPRHERWKIPIITCDGCIAAVGQRVDNSFVAKENKALFIIIQ